MATHLKIQCSDNIIKNHITKLKTPKNALAVMARKQKKGWLTLR